MTLPARVSERIHRIDTSATYKVVAEAAALRSSGVDLFDFGAGEPHFSTPRHIKEAALLAIEQDFTRYTSGAGIPELRAAIAERHRHDFRTSFLAENVVVTAGGKLALFQTLQCILNEGDEVVVPVPYWVSFKDIVEYSGGKCVFVRAQEPIGLRAEQVASAVTSRTRAIIINSPCNPSGDVVDQEQFELIAQLAAKHGIFLIADECYSYLVYSTDPFSAASVKVARDNIVVIGSLSKTYAMTGWRCGYALAPVDIANAIQKLQSQSLTCVSAPIQKAALAAVSGPQDCIHAMRDGYRANRDRIIQIMLKIGGLRCKIPEGAFYAYPDVNSFLKVGESVSQLAASLLHEAHVVVVPGSAFGTPEHIRISYAVQPQMLEAGMAAMGEFLRRRS